MDIHTLPKSELDNELLKATVTLREKKRKHNMLRRSLVSPPVNLKVSKAENSLRDNGLNTSRDSINSNSFTSKPSKSTGPSSSSLLFPTDYVDSSPSRGFKNQVEENHTSRSPKRVDYLSEEMTTPALDDYHSMHISVSDMYSTSLLSAGTNLNKPQKVTESTRHPLGNHCLSQGSVSFTGSKSRFHGGRNGELGEMNHRRLERGRRSSSSIGGLSSFRPHTSGTPLRSRSVLHAPRSASNSRGGPSASQIVNEHRQEYFSTGRVPANRLSFDSSTPVMPPQPSIANQMNYFNMLAGMQQQLLSQNGMGMMPFHPMYGMNPFAFMDPSLLAAYIPLRGDGANKPNDSSGLHSEYASSTKSATNSAVEDHITVAGMDPPSPALSSSSAVSGLTEDSSVSKPHGSYSHTSSVPYPSNPYFHYDDGNGFNPQSRSSMSPVRPVTTLNGPVDPSVMTNPESVVDNTTGSPPPLDMNSFHFLMQQLIQLQSQTMALMMSNSSLMSDSQQSSGSTPQQQILLQQIQLRQLQLLQQMQLQSSLPKPKVNIPHTSNNQFPSESHSRSLSRSKSVTHMKKSASRRPVADPVSVPPMTGISPPGSGYPSEDDPRSVRSGRPSDRDSMSTKTLPGTYSTDSMISRGSPGSVNVRTHTNQSDSDASMVVSPQQNPGKPVDDHMKADTLPPTTPDRRLAKSEKNSNDLNSKFAPYLEKLSPSRKLTQSNNNIDHTSSRPSSGAPSLVHDAGSGLTSLLPVVSSSPPNGSTPPNPTEPDTGDAVPSDGVEVMNGVADGASCLSFSPHPGDQSFVNVPVPPISNKMQKDSVPSSGIHVTNIDEKSSNNSNPHTSSTPHRVRVKGPLHSLALSTCSPDSVSSDTLSIHSSVSHPSGISSQSNSTNNTKLPSRNLNRSTVSSGKRDVDLAVTEILSAAATKLRGESYKGLSTVSSTNTSSSNTSNVTAKNSSKNVTGSASNTSTTAGNAMKSVENDEKAKQAPGLMTSSGSFNTYLEKESTQVHLSDADERNVMTEDVDSSTCSDNSAVAVAAAAIAKSGPNSAANSAGSLTSLMHAQGSLPAEVYSSYTNSPGSSTSVSGTSNYSDSKAEHSRSNGSLSSGGLGQKEEASSLKRRHSSRLRSSLMEQSREGPVRNMSMSFESGSSPSKPAHVNSHLYASDQMHPHGAVNSSRTQINDVESISSSVNESGISSVSSVVSENLVIYPSTSMPRPLGSPPSSPRLTHVQGRIYGSDNSIVGVKDVPSHSVVLSTASESNSRAGSGADMSVAFVSNVSSSTFSAVDMENTADITEQLDEAFGLGKPLSAENIVSILNAKQYESSDQDLSRSESEADPFAGPGQPFQSETFSAAQFPSILRPAMDPIPGHFGPSNLGPLHEEPQLFTFNSLRDVQNADNSPVPPSTSCSSVSSVSMSVGMATSGELSSTSSTNTPTAAAGNTQRQITSRIESSNPNNMVMITPSFDTDLPPIPEKSDSRDNSMGESLLQSVPLVSTQHSNHMGSLDNTTTLVDGEHGSFTSGVYAGQTKTPFNMPFSLQSSSLYGVPSQEVQRGKKSSSTDKGSKGSKQGSTVEELPNFTLTQGEPVRTLSGVPVTKSERLIQAPSVSVDRLGINLNAQSIQAPSDENTLKKSNSSSSSSSTSGPLNPGANGVSVSKPYNNVLLPGLHRGADGKLSMPASVTLKPDPLSLHDMQSSSLSVSTASTSSSAVSSKYSMNLSDVEVLGFHREQLIEFAENHAPVMLKTLDSAWKMFGTSIAGVAQLWDACERRYPGKTREYKDNVEHMIAERFLQKQLAKRNVNRGQLSLRK